MARDRSLRPDVRNPVLALPAARQLQGLDPATRAIVRAVFVDLQTSAQAKAAESLRRHKAPMYCYWKAVGVYARHIARVLR